MGASPDLDRLLARPALTVAPRLLGSIVRHGEVAIRLVEVEAYAGPADPGSHAFRGPTHRNRVMFGPPGHLYVYFTYGMHWCANVVCGPDGTAAAVLLRAGEVVEGHRVARVRRGGARDRDLARGPARLAQALGLDGSHNGADLGHGPILLEPRRRAHLRADIDSGPRVGLRLAADRPWRFWLRGDPSVSPYRPAAARRSADPPADPPADPGRF